MNRPSACQMYLDELSLSLIKAQDEDKDGINLDDPRYSYFVALSQNLSILLTLASI